MDLDNYLDDLPPPDEQAARDQFNDEQTRELMERH
jgi:hypothetical protein